MDQARQKALLIFATGCSLAGFGWGSIYFYLGIGYVGLLPFVFSITVGLALVGFRIFGWVRLLLWAQLGMILLIPTLLQWTLGGFHESGMVIIWSLTAPLGALVLQNFRQALWWLAAMLSAVVVSLIFDQSFQTSSATQISEGTLTFFYGMNLIGMTLVSFLALVFYDQTLRAERFNRNALIEELNHTTDQLLVSIGLLSQGDLRQKLNAEDGPKQAAMQRLIQGYNRSLELLSDSPGNLHKNSQTVSRTVTEINHSIEELRNTNAEQTDRIANSETGLQTIRTDSQAIAQALTGFATTSRENTRIARESGEVIKQATQNLHNLASAMQASASTIHGLENRAGEIGSIIAVIKEIADRTALLSLNASIEAARAGEAGRGFSVVAHEIGQLAESTTKSTTQITRHIELILGGITQAVHEASTNEKTIQDGLQSAGLAQHAILNIVQRSELLQDEFEQIESRSQSQIGSIQNIDIEIQSMLKSTRRIVSQVKDLYDRSLNVQEATRQMHASLQKISY